MCPHCVVSLSKLLSVNVHGIDIPDLHRFLLSTHYTHYNPLAFAVNLSVLVFCLLPKLPMVSIALHNILYESSELTLPSTVSS